MPGPTCPARSRRSHAAALESNTPRFFGISRVACSPIWWHAWQPRFSVYIHSA
jgi:hypothetical protein